MVVILIPEDVITDILSRLPVKPLLRFRCVCKPWRDLIDSPAFVKLHLDQTKKSNSHRKLIQQGNSSDIYWVDFDTMIKTNIADVVSVPDPFGAVGVINCCNGLVLVAKSDALAIWNPSTKRYQMIPDLDSLPPLHSSYQRSGIRVFSGIGYDVLGDDYKVIFIKQSDSDFEKSLPSEVHLYNLKSNSWKQIQPFPYYLKFEKSPGVAACGSVHCVVGETKWCTNQWIAAFDLATGEYRIVPQPKYPSDVDFYIYLESLGGCLSLMWGYRDYVDIWVLKEYGKPESWTKITNINASAFSDNCFGFVRTIEYSVTEKELILEKSTSSISRYDIKKKLAKDVHVRSGRKFPIYSHTYQESLVQLKTSCANVPRKEAARNNKKIEKPKKRDKFLSQGFKLVL